MRRRRGIMGLNGGAGIPVITATATGNPLTFETDMVKPLKSLVVPFSPIQDLHGMPNPYPAGASANLIPDGTNTANGYEAGKFYRTDNTAYASTAYYTSEYFEVDQTKTYTYSTSTLSGKTPAILFYDENKTFISGINFVTGYTQTFTPPSGAKYARAPQTTDEYKATHDPYVYYQFQVGSTATAYRRYSNVCPISGWMGCNIYHEDEYDAAAAPVIALIWQSTVGIVYGATLTVNEDGSADLVNKWVGYEFTGLSSEGWEAAGKTGAEITRFRRNGNPDSGWSNPNAAGPAGAISNYLTNQSTNYLYNGHAGFGFYHGQLFVGIQNITTLSDFKLYLADNPLTVVYPIAQRSQTTHHLTASQLVTLLGTNTIWTDTNGTNTATYLKHQS